MSYASLSEVKRYLGITSADDDALLNSLILASKKIIDNVTNRTFAASSDTIRYYGADAVDGMTLYFDADQCDIEKVTNGDGVIVASTKYTTRPRNASPYFAIVLDDDSAVSWDTDSGEIAVEGRWAWSITPPDDIVHACVRLTAYLYRQKDNASDLDRTIIAGNSALLPSELPRDVLLLLSPYKRRT